MGDFTLVVPKGWEYDLHSIYSAYMGYFQLHSVPWYDRSWGHLFSSFEGFLSFSWPVVTVTDVYTGRPHIVTRLTSLDAFLKMIRTRFGERLIQAPNILKVTPFETTNRHVRTISDYASYKKMHSTLPAIALTAFKARVRAGEPDAIRKLWDGRDKTFLAIDFEWSERNQRSCLEFGYAAVRCAQLGAIGPWPPVPDINYRKGHFIVVDYIDKVVNKHCPNYPWQYAFGDSQVVPKHKLPQIIQAVISSFATPDSETHANDLVLIGHNIQGDLRRLEEMKIRVPHNVLIVDIEAYERELYRSGLRGKMGDPKTQKLRSLDSRLSLETLLRSFNISDNPDEKHGSPSLLQLPNCVLHNSGNDALMCLLAFQMLLEPSGTQIPVPKSIKMPRAGYTPSPAGTPPMPLTPDSMMALPLYTGNGLAVNAKNDPGPSAAPDGSFMHRPSSTYDLAAEFGKMQVGKGPIPRTRSTTRLASAGRLFLPGKRQG